MWKTESSCSIAVLESTTRTSRRVSRMVSCNRIECNEQQEGNKSRGCKDSDDAQYLQAATPINDNVASSKLVWY